MSIYQDQPNFRFPMPDALQINLGNIQPNLNTPQIESLKRRVNLCGLGTLVCGAGTAAIAVTVAATPLVLTTGAVATLGLFVYAVVSERALHQKITSINVKFAEANIKMSVDELSLIKLKELLNDQVITEKVYEQFVLKSLSKCEQGWVVDSIFKEENVEFTDTLRDAISTQKHRFWCRDCNQYLEQRKQIPVSLFRTGFNQGYITEVDFINFIISRINAANNFLAVVDDGDFRYNMFEMPERIVKAFKEKWLAYLESDEILKVESQQVDFIETIMGYNERLGFEFTPAEMQIKRTELTTRILQHYKDNKKNLSETGALKYFGMALFNYLPQDNPALISYCKDQLVIHFKRLVIEIATHNSYRDYHENPLNFGSIHYNYYDNLSKIDQPVLWETQLFPLLTRILSVTNFSDDDKRELAERIQKDITEQALKNSKAENYNVSKLRERFGNLQAFFIAYQEKNGPAEAQNLKEKLKIEYIYEANPYWPLWTFGEHPYFDGIKKSLQQVSDLLQLNQSRNNNLNWVQEQIQQVKAHKLQDEDMQLLGISLDYIKENDHLKYLKVSVANLLSPSFKPLFIQTVQHKNCGALFTEKFKQYILENKQPAKVVVDLVKNHPELFETGILTREIIEPLRPDIEKYASEEIIGNLSTIINAAISRNHLARWSWTGDVQMREESPPFVKKGLENILNYLGQTPVASYTSQEFRERIAVVQREIGDLFRDETQMNLHGWESAKEIINKNLGALPVKV